MAYDFSESNLPPVFDKAPHIPSINIQMPAHAKPVPPMAKDKFVPATVNKTPAMPVKPPEAPVENPHKAN